MTKHFSVGAFCQEFPPLGTNSMSQRQFFFSFLLSSVDIGIMGLTTTAMHLRISWVIVEGDCVPNQYGQIQQSPRPAPIRGCHPEPLRPVCL